MTTSKAHTAWDGLNDRQRTYLDAIFHEDQAREEAHHADSARTWSSTPARVWRRIPLNSAGSSLASRLRSKGVHDPGAGSTLSALCTRGLAEVDHVPGILSDIVCVRITPAGRAAARAGLGYGPRWVKPRWALSEWLWREFTKVVAAGEDGLQTDQMWHSAHGYLVDGELARGNRPYLCVVVTWEKVNRAYPGEPPRYINRERRRYRLTDTGRAHYTERLADYREIYPEVVAPDVPPEPADTP
ncbi:hypothetical protein ACIQZO_06160 [Streptomyces sp. NPDC097617]|uniref:hypothetical protein n=1 Tax=Streptomyces sp. NPDC097617 TaxID=3366091 RepID=UPI003815E097